MTSVCRRTRNRLNALKSTGPRSESGKRISSANARKHGASSPPRFPDNGTLEWLALACPSCGRADLTKLARALTHLHQVRRAKAACLVDLEGSVSKVGEGRTFNDLLTKYETLTGYERRARSSLEKLLGKAGVAKRSQADRL